MYTTHSPHPHTLNYSQLTSLRQWHSRFSHAPKTWFYNMLFHKEKSNQLKTQAFFLLVTTYQWMKMHGDKMNIKNDALQYNTWTHSNNYNRRGQIYIDNCLLIEFWLKSTNCNFKGHERNTKNCILQYVYLNSHLCCIFL